MTDAGRHPRITIHTLSEVVDVKGYVGNFDVRIVKKTRYVNEKECTACGDSAKACPVARPDEFDVGLSSRKAISVDPKNKQPARVAAAERAVPNALSGPSWRIISPMPRSSPGSTPCLVSGCHIGDCHYIDANHWTEKRIDKVRKKMGKKGIRPERLQLKWISAAEGLRFAQVMAEMEALRRQVSEKEISETMAALKKG
jgi:ferredoxin